MLNSSFCRLPIQAPVRCCSFCAGSFNANLVREHLQSTASKRSATKNEENSNGSFRMVLPPPNVTGNLHVGHALTVTVEDTFCRYHKFMGKDVIWYPGFDHAGIATQTIVEKKLFRDTGKYRRDISDGEFLRYCEMWKNDRIREISNQLNLLSADLNWSKLFYTMDENFSSVVSTAFCKFYEDDLIYRDKRVVNWCPVLESTISDQEVEVVDDRKICSRSGAEVVQVEKEQWFLRCDQLHDAVLNALRNGEIKIKPELVEGKLVEWLNYSEPWCLSRQLLWGHKIPVYFDQSSNRWIIAESRAKALKQAKGNVDELAQDPDVLDTWFSSSLIPLVVAGWPQRAVSAPFLDVMETGHDIIGFWVARMLALCKRLTGYFPFTNVVLHGLIRDSTGRKMSKSLGNVVDPLDVIQGITLEKMLNRLKESNLPASEIESASADLQKRFPNGMPAYGTDALRFAFLRHKIISLDVDMNIGETADLGNRFCNKVWNLAKFAQIIFDAAESNDSNNVDGTTSTSTDLRIEDQWLRSRLAATLATYHQSMRDYDPHSAFNALYLFILTDLCDFYVETTKQALWSNDKIRLTQIATEISNALGKSLKMLSTFMPYISNYLLDGFAARNLPTSLLQDDSRGERDVKIEQDMHLANEIILSIRSFRKNLNIPKKILLEGCLMNDGDGVENFCRTYGGIVSTFCNFSFVSSQSERFNNCASYPCNVAGTSSTLRVMFEAKDSNEILQILQKQSRAARTRLAKVEEIAADAAKTRDEKLAAPNADKPFLQRHIQKLQRVVDNSARNAHNLKAEIEKLENILNTIGGRKNTVDTEEMPGTKL